MSEKNREKTVNEERVSRRKMIAKGAAIAAGAVAAAALPSVAEAADTDTLQVALTKDTSSSPASAATGVQDASGNGAYMVTPSQCGLIGRGHWVGVMGEAVDAQAIGLEARNEHKGTALNVRGRNVFSRSGRVLFPVGKRAMTITVPSTGPALVWSSWILATLQGPGGSGCSVQYTKRTGSYTFQIVLTKPVTAKVYCAWFILN